MKLTTRQLRQIIKEEVQAATTRKLLKEQAEYQRAADTLSTLISVGLNKTSFGQIASIVADIKSLGGMSPEYIEKLNLGQLVDLLKAKSEEAPRSS